MNIGFTGTRKGFACRQMDSFSIWWNKNSSNFNAFLHGCAIGADCWAARFVRNRSSKMPIFGYPSNIPSQTSSDAIEICDSIFRPEKPLIRNRDIVEQSDLLVACPAQMTEEQMSGTWATVRYARKLKKKIVIIWPDGSITTEN